MPDYTEIFNDPKFAKYADYAPQYDDWQEQFINREYGFQSQEYGLAGDLYALAGERYGMAQERNLFQQVQRGEARGTAQERLDRQLTGMGQQMSGTLAQSQESAYDILGQGEQLAAGGLGARSGMTRRAMRGIEGSAERALGTQAMAGLEAKSQYKDTLSELSASAFGSAQQLGEAGLAYDQSGITYEAAGIAFDRAGMQRERQFAQLEADWEDEMLDYLTMLGQEFDIWYEGDLSDFGDDDPTDDPLFNPDDDNWEEPGPVIPSDPGTGGSQYDDDPKPLPGDDDDDDDNLPPHTGP